MWDAGRRLNGLTVDPSRARVISSSYCPKSKIGRTEYANGFKEIYTDSVDPPRKLVVDINPPKNVIKTFYPKPKNSDGDTGHWPFGPYDILLAERLQQYHQ